MHELLFQCVEHKQNKQLREKQFYQHGRIWKGAARNFLGKRKSLLKLHTCAHDQISSRRALPPESQLVNHTTERLQQSLLKPVADSSSL